VRRSALLTLVLLVGCSLGCSAILGIGEIEPPADGGAGGSRSALGTEGGAGGVGSTIGPQAVLYGGFDGAKYLNDTWTFDGENWQKLNPTQPCPDTCGSVTDPGPRAWASATVFGGKVLLFGGEAGGLGGYDDFWSWDGTYWEWVGNMPGITNFAGELPGERSRSAATAMSGYVLLFSGLGYSSDGTNATLSDTWTWDGSNWTQVFSGSGPSSRASAAGGGLSGKTLIYGGQHGPNVQPGCCNVGDTWSFDGSAWTQVAGNGPPARSFATGGTLGDTYVLFGGAGPLDVNAPSSPPPLSLFGDTWIFDGSTWTQSQAEGPQARLGASAVQLGGKLYLFGGATGTYGTDGSPAPLVFDDTWVWDGKAWTRLNIAGPSPRMGAMFVAP
jgi:galactose oxidase-like protein